MKNWIPVMEDAMKKNSNFFAVGAGHLPGENGVINLLRKAGYTLTPVK
ncbi:MAG: TraB/GumN family protein [Bacteroidia bacterium]|nr:TraB/GumN family protein [Bacteroidia bacterium]